MTGAPLVNAGMLQWCNTSKCSTHTSDRPLPRRDLCALFEGSAANADDGAFGEDIFGMDAEAFVDAQWDTQVAEV